jgi:nitrate reductase gamma subunit
MNVNYVVSLIAVIVLSFLAYAGAGLLGLEGLFGIIIPYLAVALFIYGVIARIAGWARSPVPFRITTTAGQQETLPWIKQDKIDNPSSTGGVIVRMLLEIFLFRSLFRNTSASLDGSGKLAFRLEKWLWLFALAFHYAFLAVILRHLRFFLEPVPACIQLLETLDGFLQVGLPVMMLSGVVLLAAVTFLFIRRLFIGRVRYISLASDYFPLFLIFGIAFTGLLMRYFTKASIVKIKELAMGLVTFHPVVPEGIDVIFYIHLFLVCVLLAYFPFSKLMHMGGIFLSPTRNMTGNTRAVRHVNPWNYPVAVHTYQEYEDEFREKMIEAGLPVEKE